MLILTRRPDQVIRIGDDIVVTILGTRGNQVRVGVSAPKEVPVHREEVYEQIQRERASRTRSRGVENADAPLVR